MIRSVYSTRLKRRSSRNPDKIMSPAEEKLLEVVEYEGIPSDEVAIGV